MYAYVNSVIIGLGSGTVSILYQIITQTYLWKYLQNVSHFSQASVSYLTEAEWRIYLSVN